jgi:hypothetical protein
MQTKFAKIYESGNRSNAVANIILFGKSMNLDFSTIEMVITGLVQTSGDPISDKELVSTIAYHAKK